MRYGRSERLLVLIAIVSLLAMSCSGVQRPPANPLEVLTSVSLDPSEAKTGEEVVVTIALENQTEQDIVLNFGNQQQVGFRVSTPRGKLLVEQPTWFQPAPSALVLSANNGRSFDITLVTKDLAPGTYIVQGGILGSEATYPWGSVILKIKR